MPIPIRLFQGDVEQGKRDDDHKPWPKGPAGSRWYSRRFISRRSYKKSILVLLLLAVGWWLLMVMTSAMGGFFWPPRVRHSNPEDRIQTGPDGEEDHAGESEHWFSGPIKFYDLAVSLRAIPSSRVYNPNNRNILFAASSIKSASILLPLACEMANLKRNRVHFAFMGRDIITIGFLKQVNGVRDKDCDVLFHDSRPDFLLQSSDYRMEVSNSAGFGYIHNAMHPQAVIIDNSGTEDEFFLKAFRDRVPALGTSLIQLPAHSEENLRWFTRLDSASLKFWNKVKIDIVIHAQPAASGSLFRLLRTLVEADYFDSPPPSLTIELPHEIDEPTQRFVKNYKWPPSGYSIDGDANQLNLRRRIPQPTITPEESTVRFLESFWPADPETTHLLVLSPQVELSPLYFHYLKYLILEYRHSAVWSRETSLMSISLDLPSTHLNVSATFSIPRNLTGVNTDPDSAAFFLWQAPNSNAALYFGDKWTELHSFVSHSLTSQRTRPTPTTLNTKQVSTAFPSWLEYILQLARARGFYSLYSTLTDQTALATLHGELYQIPEEYAAPQLPDEVLLADTDNEKNELAADPALHVSGRRPERALAAKSLLGLLPSQGTLPGLTNMPMLGWDGTPLTTFELGEEAARYRRVFRREIGGCGEADEGGTRVPGSADDLFCLDAAKNQAGQSAA